MSNATKRWNQKATSTERHTLVCGLYYLLESLASCHFHRLDSSVNWVQIYKFVWLVAMNDYIDILHNNLIRIFNYTKMYVVMSILHLWHCIYTLRCHHYLCNNHFTTVLMWNHFIYLFKTTKIWSSVGTLYIEP